MRAPSKQIRASNEVLFIIRNSVEELKNFLDKNVVDINYTDGNGSSALHWAMMKKRSKVVVQLLIDRGADVNVQTNLGYTALMLDPDIEVARLLIENGADVNIRDKKGQTALQSTNNVKLARLFIENGADVNLQDKEGGTALMDSTTPEFTQLLIDNGADVNLQDKYGNSALHNSIDKNRPQILSLLLEAGANVNLVNVKGETALHIATDQSTLNMEMIKLLLMYGADVNIRDKKGKLAVEGSACISSPACRTLLIQETSITATSSQNKTFRKVLMDVLTRYRKINDHVSHDVKTLLINEDPILIDSGLLTEDCMTAYGIALQLAAAMEDLYKNENKQSSLARLPQSVREQAFEMFETSRAKKNELKRMWETQNTIPVDLIRPLYSNEQLYYEINIDDVIDDLRDISNTLKLCSKSEALLHVNTKLIASLLKVQKVERLQRQTVQLTTEINRIKQEIGEFLAAFPEVKTDIRDFVRQIAPNPERFVYLQTL